MVRPLDFVSLLPMVAVVAVQSSVGVNAFVHQPLIVAAKPRTTRTITTTTTTCASSSSSNTDDELENLEKARASFEFLMHNSFGLIRDNADLPVPHSKDEYTPRPLTESSRHRRQLEMDLIESLEDSDEAIEELMSLWMVERGMEPGEALHEMEVVCSPGLVKEEQILRDLLDDYGIHWSELSSRLASVKYYQGNSAESEIWCEIALAVKPWHFEAVHTHVLNALRDQDLARAIRWQRKALPALNPKNNNKSRKAWVQRALKDAQESMDKAEAAAAERKKMTSFIRESEVWQ